MLWYLYTAAARGRSRPLAAADLAQRLRVTGQRPTTAAAVRTHVKTLRQKIEQDLHHPRLLGHVRGQGYVLLLPAGHSAEGTPVPT